MTKVQNYDFPLVRLKQCKKYYAHFSKAIFLFILIT